MEWEERRVWIECLMGTEQEQGNGPRDRGGIQFKFKRVRVKKVHKNNCILYCIRRRTHEVSLKIRIMLLVRKVIVWY